MSGETWQEAGVRELFEETGIEVSPQDLEPFRCWDSSYPDVDDLDPRAPV